MVAAVSAAVASLARGSGLTTLARKTDEILAASLADRGPSTDGASVGIGTNDRDGARSVAGRMTAVSQAPNVRGHGFQMHHYRGCARNPLMGWRCKAAFFASFLCRGKERRCRPAQGAYP